MGEKDERYEGWKMVSRCSDFHFRWTEEPLYKDKGNKRCLFDGFAPRLVASLHPTIVTIYPSIYDLICDDLILSSKKKKNYSTNNYGWIRYINKKSSQKGIRIK